MFSSGRNALPDDRGWSGDPPGCPKVVGRPSWMTGSGLETLPGEREAHSDVREVLPDVREGSKALLEVQ